MIWGETYEMRQAREGKWHTWFAWYPTWLADGRIAWLQTIERRRRILMSYPGTMWWLYRERVS